MSNAFDEIAGLYDLMVPWESRLEREKPFFEKIFGAPPKKILDAACGTGRHGILFASLGHIVTGADLSKPAIELAREHAGKQNAPIRLVVEDLKSLTRTFEKGSFDIVTVLGNSLLQFTEEEDIRRIFSEISSILRAGGRFIFQIVNFSSSLVLGERFSPLRVASREGQEILFQKFFDFNGDKVCLNLLIFIREGEKWIRKIASNELRSWKSRELKQMLENAGFASIDAYGDFQGSPFIQEKSKDLIVVAGK